MRKPAFLTLKNWLGFRRNANGNVAILSAMTIFMLFGFAALTIDVGSFYYQKRKLQGATDLAAVAAATDIANAQNAANATLSQNGFGASTLKTIEYGTYTANTSVAPANRFVVQSSPSNNAVRLTTQTTSPMFFGRVFGIYNAVADPASSTPTSSVLIGAKSVAAQSFFASFSIGSGLASLNNGVLNSLLGSMLGGNISLSLLDYQNLANANIDLFAFSNALATRVGLTAATYDQLAHANVQVGDLLGALVDTASTTTGVSSATISALSQIALSGTATSQTTLSNLVSFGPYAQASVGTAPLTATLDALDLVSAIAQISNGTNQVSTALAVNIPGIASVSLQLAIGQRPVGTSLVAIGATNATVTTAQTRLALNVQLLASGQSSLLNVPIYIDLAAATATLSALNCVPSNPSASTVTLSVQPSVANAYIGSVSSAAFANLGTPLSPSAATLLNVLGIAKVTGGATATISNMTPTPVTFTYADVQAKTGKVTSTTDYLVPLLTSLTASLASPTNPQKLTVTALGLPILVPVGLDTLVAATINTAITPIDQLLASVLTALGINIGNATTWVTGMSCTNSVLVN